MIKGKSSQSLTFNTNQLKILFHTEYWSHYHWWVSKKVLISDNLQKAKKSFLIILSICLSLCVQFDKIAPHFLSSPLKLYLSLSSSLSSPLVNLWKVGISKLNVPWWISLKIWEVMCINARNMLVKVSLAISSYL